MGDLGLIEELVKIGGPGAVLVAAVIWILGDRGLISSKKDEIGKKLSATLETLQASLHEDSERNSIEHKHIIENLLLLTQALNSAKEEIHEVNLFVREK